MSRSRSDHQRLRGQKVAQFARNKSSSPTFLLVCTMSETCLVLPAHNSLEACRVLFYIYRDLLKLWESLCRGHQPEPSAAIVLPARQHRRSTQWSWRIIAFLTAFEIAQSHLLVHNLSYLHLQASAIFWLVDYVSYRFPFVRLQTGARTIFYVLAEAVCGGSLWLSAGRWRILQPHATR